MYNRGLRSFPEHNFRLINGRATNHVLVGDEILLKPDFIALLQNLNKTYGEVIYLYQSPHYIDMEAFVNLTSLLDVQVSTLAMDLCLYNNLKVYLNTVDRRIPIVHDNIGILNALQDNGHGVVRRASGVYNLAKATGEDPRVKKDIRKVSDLLVANNSV